MFWFCDIVKDNICLPFNVERAERMIPDTEYGIFQDLEDKGDMPFELTQRMDFSLSTRDNLVHNIQHTLMSTYPTKCYSSSQQ